MVVPLYVFSVSQHQSCCLLAVCHNYEGHFGPYQGCNIWQNHDENWANIHIACCKKMLKCALRLKSHRVFCTWSCIHLLFCSNTATFPPNLFGFFWRHVSFRDGFVDFRLQSIVCWVCDELFIVGLTWIQEKYIEFKVVQYYSERFWSLLGMFWRILSLGCCNRWWHCYLRPKHTRWWC